MQLTIVIPAIKSSAGTSSVLRRGTVAFLEDCAETIYRTSRNGEQLQNVGITAEGQTLVSKYDPKTIGQPNKRMRGGRFKNSNLTLIFSKPCLRTG